MTAPRVVYRFIGLTQALSPPVHGLGESSAAESAMPCHATPMLCCAAVLYIPKYVQIIGNVNTHDDGGTEYY